MGCILLPWNRGKLGNKSVPPRRLNRSFAYLRYIDSSCQLAKCTNPNETAAKIRGHSFPTVEVGRIFIV